MSIVLYVSEHSDLTTVSQTTQFATRELLLFRPLFTWHCWMTAFGFWRGSSCWAKKERWLCMPLKWAALCTSFRSSINTWKIFKRGLRQDKASLVVEFSRDCCTCGKHMPYWLKEQSERGLWVPLMKINPFVAKLYDNGSLDSWTFLWNRRTGPGLKRNCRTFPENPGKRKTNHGCRTWCFVKQSDICTGDTSYCTCQRASSAFWAPFLERALLIREFGVSCCETPTRLTKLSRTKRAHRRHWPPEVEKTTGLKYRETKKTSEGKKTTQKFISVSTKANGIRGHNTRPTRPASHGK